jgi:hypothetical protein
VIVVVVVVVDVVVDVGGVVVVVVLVEVVVDVVAFCPVGVVVVVTGGDAAGESATVDGAARTRVPLTKPQASATAALRPGLG